MKLTLQQLEAHLWGAANILRGKTAGQDYKNYILSLMFYKRLCDQWECEADEAKFWLTVQSLCRETERAKQWLCRHQAQLTVDLASALERAPESGPWAVIEKTTG